MPNRFIYFLMCDTGYLVVATMAGMDHIVGFFGKPDDGQILTCQLASNATILNVL